MRVLVGYDGSAAADGAVFLVAAIRWPPDSTIRVVGVVERTLALDTPAAPGPGVPMPALEEELERHLEARVGDVVRRLGGPERAVDGAIRHGRPASILVQDAEDLAADVVVVGSRGHGAIESLVTGSVSSEVVDEAPCPVVVARAPAMTRVVFGWDGSEAAARAEAVLAGWAIFDGVPIRIVSVADRRHPIGDDAGPTMDMAAAEARARAMAAAAGAPAEATSAEAAAARLRAAGREVDVSVRRGDAAREIITAAEEANADLIVVGTRGRTGLVRIVLGSVARNVLHGSPVSVLTVHPPRPERKRRP